MKGQKGRREAADIFMNGAENPGAGAQWPHPGPLSPAPSQWPAALHSRGLAHTLQSGPSDQALGPSPCGGRRGGCFCTAPASASTGKSEVGGGRRKGPPTGERVPAVKWGRFRTRGANERGQASWSQGSLEPGHPRSQLWELEASPLRDRAPPNGHR